MAGRVAKDELRPTAWFSRFRSRYDASASDPSSDLGLFYERHRDFARSEAQLGVDRLEYTSREWTNMLGSLAGRLAMELGFEQVVEWTSGAELMWFRLSGPPKTAVLIHEADSASDSILTQVVPRLVRSRAALSVLVMYPDFPPSDHTATLEGATELWRARIEATLKRLAAGGAFLLLTIGSNEWEVPAPWRGFSWDPRKKSLNRVTRESLRDRKGPPP